MMSLWATIGVSS